MKTNLLTKLLLTLIFMSSANNIFAQIIYPIDNDNSKFPLVTNSFYILDNSFDPIVDIAVQDFELKDQGVIYPNLILEKVDFTKKSDISLLITLDLSPLNKSNFQFAKELAEAISNQIDSETEVALSSYDLVSMMNQDFTMDKTKVLENLHEIKASPYSDYTKGLISKPYGATEIFTVGQFEKKMILITDNHQNLGTDGVIEELTKQGIQLYIVQLGKYFSEDLQAISKATGGKCFNNTYINQSPENLAKLLVSVVYGLEPHSISYMARLNCDSERTTEVTYLPSNLTFNQSYTVNVSARPNIMKEPEFVGFSSVVPNFQQTNFRDEEIKLTAVNDDIEIDSIYLVDNFNKVFQIVEGQIISKTIIPKDSEHLIKLRYAPFDSAIVFTKLIIVSNSCSNDTILITGGFPNTPPNKKTIEIVYPNCQETLVVGDTVTIKWTGLLPKDVVQLEYSIENGRPGTWKPLASDISGLEYKWLVPDEISDSVKIKIIQQWPNNIGRTLNFIHKDAVFSARFNKIGDEIITSNESGIATLWNANTGSKLMEYGIKGDPDSHLSRVNWAEFSPNEKLVVTASDDKNVKIWDKLSGNLVQTLKGHTDKVTSARFSHDGQLLVSASWDRSIKVWRTDNWSLVKTITPDNVYKGKFASFSKDDKSIAVAMQSGFIKIYKVGTWNLDFEIDAKEGKPVAQLEFVEYSQDSQKIMASNITDPKVNVYDISTRTKLYELKHTPSSTQKQQINSASYYIGKDKWGNNVQRILTAGSDGLVIEWNGLTGDSLRVYKEHSSVVFTATYNFDGTRVLTSSADSTAKIWKLDSNFIQIDTTDCNFRIKKALANLADVHLGDVINGRFKDTVVSAMINNESDFDYEIRKIEIIDDADNEFSFLDGEKTKILTANGSVPIELNFNPKSVGFKTAKLRLVIPAKSIESTISANSIQASIEKTEDFIDFETVEINEFADKIGTYFENVDNKSLKIDSVTVDLPNKQNFNLIQANQTEISPNEKINLITRFIPENIFRQNGTISVWHQGNNSPSKISMKGIGVVPRYDTARIEISNIEGVAGEIVEASVFLRGISSLGIQKGITGIQSTLKFNGTLLLPIEGFDHTESNGYERTLIVKYEFPNDFEDLTKGLTDYKLGTIKFKVGLGNDSLSPLTFSNTFPLGKGKIILSDTTKSLFTLLGICRAGSPRLFKDNGTKRFLSQNYPNPVIHNTTTIEFSLLEAGISELVIYDVMGNLVKEVFKGDLRIGEYQSVVDVSDLPSGTYTYVLKLPTTQYIKRMQVTR